MISLEDLGFEPACRTGWKHVPSLCGRSISYVNGVNISLVAMLLGHFTHKPSGCVTHTIVGADAPRDHHNELWNI